MNNYQKALIEEHAQLICRIDNLNNSVYSGPVASVADETIHKVDAIEYVNQCIQLSAMKKYEEALRARLSNSCIMFENGQYFENIATINQVITVEEVPTETTSENINSEVVKEVPTDE